MTHRVALPPATGNIARSPNRAHFRLAARAIPLPAIPRHQAAFLRVRLNPQRLPAAASHRALPPTHPLYLTHWRRPAIILRDDYMHREVSPNAPAYPTPQ